MNISKLSYRNMMSRPLSTTLSLVLLTLGVGIISLLLQLNRLIQEQMENNIRGVDMVVGAKGSPLQLILSAVYHMDAPTGNISLREAEHLQKNGLVASGIPLSYGDSYEGYRIVGTDLAYPKLYNATIDKGRFWQEPFEVAVGAKVAGALDLKIGDSFIGAHGLTNGGEAHRGHAYEVVGIMNYTNSVLDQLILTTTESVWEVHHHEEGDGHAAEEEGDHDHHAHEQGDHDKVGHDDDRHTGDHDHEHEHEITAMLIQFRSPMGLMQLPRMVNEDTNMQAAIPAYEINRLFGLMGIGIDTINTIALVIMAISGLSVFISLYNAMKDRQYEMALIRTYGSTRWQLVWMVLQEGLLLTLVGFLLGICFSRMGIWLVSGFMEAGYNYSFTGWMWLTEEWWLLLTSLAIGLLASLVPAINAFYINISKVLVNG